MRGRLSPRTVLGVASLGAAVAFVDATIVNIAFPNIERSFPGASISTLSWVLNAYNIVFAAFLLAAGRIADLFGRRRTFIVGLNVFTGASLLCAVAPSATALIGFRVLQAIGAALLVPASLALVLNAFPPERRPHGVALLSAVGAAAAGLGPSLGGLLVSLSNWRLVFLVNIPIGVGAVWLARRRLVESRAPGRRRMPDLLGAVLLAIAVAALVLAVVKGPDWGWASVGVIVAFAVAVVSGGVVLWRSTWHRSPVIDLALIRIRTFSAANTMTIVGAAGFYGYTLTNVLFLTAVWHYSELQAGLALTPGPLVAFAVAGPMSRLTQRIGHRPVLVAGGLIWGGAVMWFVERVGVKPDFVSAWLPGMVLLGIGAGTLFPNLSGAAVASAPGESFGTATGINSVSRQVGAALGVAVVVAIIGTPAPSQALAAAQDAWTFGAACLFVAGLGCLLVGRVDSGKAPALGDAATVLLPGGIPRPAPEAPRATPRRPITAPAAVPAVRTETVADFLACVPIFAGIEVGLRAQLADRATTVRVGAGEWLFHGGDPGDAVYVVRAGRLQVVDESLGTVIRELGRGDVVGELALLTAQPRAASVRAVRAADLVSIEQGAFDALLGASPALSVALSRSLAEQLRTTRGTAPSGRPRPATVALVALDDGVPLPALARAVAEALAVYVSVALLEGEHVEPPPPGAQPAVAYGPLVDRAESEHDVVLLTVDASDGIDPWAEFCLQQGDRILAVGSGREPRPWLMGRLELRGCDLVGYGISPGSGKLAHCAELLAPLESHSVLPDRLGGDIARLARRLSGRSVGVVLSGGGARAFSHIGVLEELVAAGIQIDRVAGVSMGAFIGALFALERDLEEIDACCFDEWVQRRPLSDYTLPRHSLIRGERFKSMLHRTFGEVAIEEMPLGFICGCTELRSGSLELTRFGPLWEAVGFSICLPVLAPPQLRGRRMLIDGSLVDNLPVQAMSDMGEGPIIAVDVKSTAESGAPSGRSRPGAAGNGDGSVGASSNGERPPRTPTLGETLARVLLLGSSNTSEAARRHADLIIKPRAEGVGLLEFHQIDVAREAGRAAAREALANAPANLFGAGTAV